MINKPPETQIKFEKRKKIPEKSKWGSGSAAFYPKRTWGSVQWRQCEGEIL